MKYESVFSPDFKNLYRSCLVLRGEYFNGLTNAEVMLFVRMLINEDWVDDFSEGYLISEMAVFSDFLSEEAL